MDLVDWKDDKNLGSWDFTKQPNKLYYNQGNRISSSEDPVFTMNFTGKPITPIHDPCGYWYDSPISIPQLKVSGILWGCGNDQQHQINLTGSQYNPIFTLIGPDVCLAVPNGGHQFTSIIVEDEGILKNTGLNDRGQLGTGDKVNLMFFTAIDANQWSNACGGTYSSIALRSDGSLYGTGFNAYGEIGVGDNNERLIYTFAKSGVAQISMKSCHALLITDSGNLYGTGCNTSGELGLGDNTNRNQFTLINSSSQWAAIVAGGAHTLALDSYGNLYGTGYNAYGQLGLGNTDSKNSLTFITSDVAKIGTMLSHSSCIVKTDRTLWTTGYNSVGQLGLGDETERHSFTQVGSDSDWDFATGGIDFTLARKQDGRLYSTGTNGYGQLGLGDNVTRNLFTQVSDITCLSCFVGHDCSFIVRS